MARHEREQCAGCHHGELHLCGTIKQRLGNSFPLSFIAVIHANVQSLGCGTVVAVYADCHRGAVAFVEERRYIGHKHNVAISVKGVAKEYGSALPVHGYGVDVPAGNPLRGIETDVHNAVVVAAQVSKPRAVRRQVGAEHPLRHCLLVQDEPVFIRSNGGSRTIQDVVSVRAHREEGVDYVQVRISKGRLASTVAFRFPQGKEWLLCFWGAFGGVQNLGIVAIILLFKGAIEPIVVALERDAAVVRVAYEGRISVARQIVEGIVVGSQCQCGLHRVTERVGEAQPPMAGSPGKEPLDMEA